MAEQRPLRGSCSCGRYKYVVVVPENERNQATILFQTDDDNRRSQAALLAAFLRVPISWYSSQTVSYFPDETHHSISRTFSPVHEPHCQRKFCGYCGTHLSYWTENPREEQDYLHVTLGSLRSKDLDTLQDLDLLPEDLIHDQARDRAQDPDVDMDENEETRDIVTSRDGDVIRTVRQGNDGPVSWFEEMLDGSHLGRTRKTRRGISTSASGTTTVSWEVTEYGHDSDGEMTGSGTGSKRKLDETSDNVGT